MTFLNPSDTGFESHLCLVQSSTSSTIFTWPNSGHAAPKLVQSDEGKIQEEKVHMPRTNEKNKAFGKAKTACLPSKSVVIARQSLMRNAEGIPVDIV